MFTIEGKAEYDYKSDIINSINVENVKYFTRYDNKQKIPLTIVYNSNNSNDLNKWSIKNYYTNLDISTFKEQAKDLLKVTSNNIKDIIKKEGHKFIFLVQHEMCKEGLNTEILNALIDSIVSIYLPRLRISKTKRSKTKKSNSIQLKRLHKKSKKIKNKITKKVHRKRVYKQ